MKIEQVKGGNFIIKDVTTGKLLALQRALRLQAKTNITLSPVGFDILMEINKALENKNNQ